MRMGKGAGKLATWFIQLSGGVSLFEFKNLRKGRADHFFIQVSKKLPVMISVRHRNNNYFRISGVKRLTTQVIPFW